MCLFAEFFLIFFFVFTSRNLISNDKIDISYFAAGIMSHLGSDNNLNWCKVQDFDIHQCLLEMVSNHYQEVDSTFITSKSN